MRAVVERSCIGQLLIGDFRYNAAVILDAEQAVAGDAADRDGVQTPLAEDVEDFALAAFLRHQQHALLRFGEHDLIRSHAGFTLRHVLQVDLDADSAAAAHLTGRAGEAGRAHVLNADDGAGLHRLQTGFEQQLFQERVAHLHVGALLLGLFAEFSRRHGGAVDTVAAGLRSDVDHGVADSGCLGVEDFVATKNTQRENVHQRVAVVALLKNALPADGGDAETVSVMRNAADYAFEDSAVAGVIGRAEAERIHHGDGAGAHGENVAQDAADAGGRALERLNETGVIVGFDLEGDGVALADVDDAGVFSGALQDHLAAGGELLEMQAGALVGAVLAPHHAEDA